MIRNPFRALLGVPEPRAEAPSAMTPIGTRRRAHVTPDTALTSSAVLACLIVRAETFGSLPAHVYQSQGATRSRVEHPVTRLLTKRWNDLMTAPEGWRWEQLTEDIKGEAFVRVFWKGSTPVELWPMTGTVAVKLSPARRVYYEYSGDEVTPAGTYGTKDVLHFRGPVIKDGVRGKSLVDLAGESIGLSIDTERFYSRLLSNGSHFPGYLQTDNKLNQADVDAIGEQWKQKEGIEQAGRMRIFDRGLKWIQNGMSIKDADLTAQQEWYLQQVCRVFRIPPPLVQDWSRATYTNSEQADLWFAKHTITPIAVNKERTIARLFETTGEDKTGHYAKFELDGLMRGDYKTRMEGHEIGIRIGMLSPNGALALEDQDGYEGGDVHVMQAQMIPVSELSRATAALEPVVTNAIGSIRKRAEQDAERGRDRSQTEAFARQLLDPVAAAFAVLESPFDLEQTILQALGAPDEALV